VSFIETPLHGAFIIEPELHEDQRGFFARTWCDQEARDHSVNCRFVQYSISFNKRKGTLRGMHYQIVPYQEAKLVRCTMGAIYDVIIDLRPESATFGRHIAVILSAENRRSLYIPEGFAHGFQTLEDSTEVFYQISQFFSPAHARGIRWNDPFFGIRWPPDDRTIVLRDQQYPDFRP
jgi:dTDP-4-dehydrorhamnose 3,5-epimerase